MWQPVLFSLDPIFTLEWVILELAVLCLLTIGAYVVLTKPAGREISTPRRSRHSDPHKIFYLIKLYAVEAAATIVFLVWLARLVWKELGF